MGAFPLISVAFPSRGPVPKVKESRFNVPVTDRFNRRGILGAAAAVSQFSNGPKPFYNGKRNLLFAHCPSEEPYDSVDAAINETATPIEIDHVL
jgi:hypothetical protein